MMRRAELVGALCLVLGCGGAPPSKGTPPEETGGEGGASGTGGGGGQTAAKPDASFALAPDTGAAPDTATGTGGSAGGPEAGASEPDASPDTAAPMGPFPAEAVKAGKAALFGRVSTHTEGPSVREGSVYFASDGNGLVRADATGKVFKYHPRMAPVGTYLLADGSILACDKGHTVVQVFKDGSVGSLFSAADHNRVDFCNDITVDHKGDIFFTNPHAPGDLWRLTVDGALDKVTSCGGYCNGVEVDREGSSLYFSLGGSLRRIALPATGNNFGAPQQVVSTGDIDGMAFDVWGNLWLANVGGRKLDIFDPTRKQIIASVGAGGMVTNLCFDDGVVYTTISGSGLYKISIPGIRGFLHPGAPKYTVKQMLDWKPVNDPL